MNLVVWSAFFRNLKRIICLTARFPDLSYHPIFAKLSGSRRQIFKGFEVLWTINILVPCYYLCPKFMVFSLSCNSFFYLTTLGAENTFRITNIHTVRLCRVCLKVRLPIAFGPEIVYKKLFFLSNLKSHLSYTVSQLFMVPGKVSPTWEFNQLYSIDWNLL